MNQIKPTLLDPEKYAWVHTHKTEGAYESWSLRTGRDKLTGYLVVDRDNELEIVGWCKSLRQQFSNPTDAMLWCETMIITGAVHEKP